ncbi:MAG: hypothetical protein EA402_03505 [Planctomycetota bacterium]|nr:MAG: hypothetical protein EA402_03505 [Planctomycetota bacterium]
MDGLDAGLVSEFIEESLEGIQAAEACLLALEHGRPAAKEVQEIFRIIHSLKGNAALFGCEALKLVSHDAEYLLDGLRQGQEKPGPQIIEVLLAVLDWSRKTLGELRQGRHADVQGLSVKDLRTRLTAARSRVGPQVKWQHELFDVLQSLHNDGHPLAARLQHIAEALAVGDSVGASEGSHSPPSRLRSLLKEPIEEVLDDDTCLEVESILQEIRAAALDDEASALAEECWDGYQVFTESVGFDETLRQWLLNHVDEMATKAQWAWHNGEADSTAQVQQRSPSVSAPDMSTLAMQATGDQQRTMRVSEEHIDTFLAYVGDLLVIGDTFHHLQRRLAGLAASAHETALSTLATDLRRAHETFQGLSGKLQSSIMSIRQLPAEVLLRRLPRLVRDVASDQGKEVRVILQGEGLRLDKRLVELLDAPLVHLVRNAVDHGIESPQQRRAANKDPCAEVRISIEEDESMIRLCVSDDGRGLDHAAIRQSAERRGLLAPGAVIDADTLSRLIFSSGLSTAKEVSEISGRGVGLDVVHASIVEAGGRIDIEFQPGMGTQFRMSLPKSVTTEIIQGFLVRVREHVLVLPMDRVHSNMRFDAERLHRLESDRYGYRSEDSIFPVIPLAAVFDPLAWSQISTASESERVGVCCQIRHGQDLRRFLLVVDAVLGVQQVVVRAIDGLGTDTRLISGGALLGDGSVALIIDLDCLCGAGHPSQTGPENIKILTATGIG